jgi:predicted MFS family arabinose efflux permease
VSVSLKARSRSQGRGARLQRRRVETTTDPALPWNWWVPEIGWLVFAVVCGFTGFYFTLAALPYWVVGNGASVGQAGLITTVMLGATVLSQPAVPAIMHRLGAERAFGAGLLLLGAPAPLYPLSTEVSWALMLSAIRGVGFAFLTVVSVALLARLVTAERRPRALGVHGLAINVPNLIVVPLGVVLAESGHFTMLAWLAAVPAVASVAAVPLARMSRSAPDDGVETAHGSYLRRASAAVAPAVVLFFTCVCAIGVMTFLPIDAPVEGAAPAALLGFGLTATLVRWRIGVWSDRWGIGALFGASAAAMAVGAATVGASLTASGAVFVVCCALGCLLAGVGYGGVQTLSLVSALHRTPPNATAGASAVWNMAFDSGLGLGALAIGVVAGTGVGVAMTLVGCAVVLSAAVPIARATGGRA